MCKLYYTGNVIPVDCIITIILKYGEKHRSLNHKPTRVYHINNLHTRGGGAWNIIPGDIKNRKKKLCTEIECVAGIVVSFVKCDLGMGGKKRRRSKSRLPACTKRRAEGRPGRGTDGEH